MTRAALAGILLAAVLMGGFFYGALQVITDTGPDW